MPIYVYEVEGGTCPDCPGRFDMLEGINDPPLRVCPACERPVRRIMAPAVGIVKGAGGNPIEKAQAAGFRALKRDDDGSLVDIKTKEKVKPPRP
ncbi:MAG TPA: FmdB family zinc ribbon protein [bacterium]|nr:FmdB family zinc ribbon protein [bacterium]